MTLLPGGVVGLVDFAEIFALLGAVGMVVFVAWFPLLTWLTYFSLLA
jgi:hypothetical protein